jgi:hypothetical protein
MPTAISARSVRGGRPSVRGSSAPGRGCPLDDPCDVLGTGASWATGVSDLWHAHLVTVDRDAVLAQALVEEVCKKSALVWVRPVGANRSQAVWYAWIDGAVHLVTGGIEQPLSDVPDGCEVDVTARSKDTGGRVVTFRAVVRDLEPDGDAWATVVPELHGKRLNAPDGEEQPARWARESRVLRLAPAGRLVEGPGHLSHRSHAAEPVPSTATTRGPLPFIVGRRARRRSL